MKLLPGPLWKVSSFLGGRRPELLFSSSCNSLETSAVSRKGLPDTFVKLVLWSPPSPNLKYKKNNDLPDLFLIRSVLFRPRLHVSSVSLRCNLVRLPLRASPCAAFLRCIPAWRSCAASLRGISCAAFLRGIPRLACLLPPLPHAASPFPVSYHPTVCTNSPKWY